MATRWFHFLSRLLVRRLPVPGGPRRSAAWLLLPPLLALAGCAARTPDWARESPTLTEVQQDAACACEWREFDWLDEARGRRVPVRLYQPQGQAPAAGWPLVVFSHGLGGSRRGYSYLGRHWASQGYAVLHVQHVGSDRQLWGGNPVALVMRLQEAARQQEALARAQDMHHALDRLLASGLLPIDAARIAVAGHSYGANTSLLLVGARPEGVTEAQLPLLRDPRYKAAILISAPPFYGLGDMKPILADVAVPTLHITATGDVITVPGYHSDMADRLELYAATALRSGADKTLVVFAGGSHSIFTDRMGTGGAVLNPRVKAATQALTARFLARALGGDGEGLAPWAHQHRELLDRWQEGDGPARLGGGA